MSTTIIPPRWNPQTKTKSIFSNVGFRGNYGGGTVRIVNSVGMVPVGRGTTKVAPKEPEKAKEPPVKKDAVEEPKPEVKPPEPTVIEEPKVEVASVPEVVEPAVAEPVAEQSLLVEQPVAEERTTKKRRRRRGKRAAAEAVTAELI